MGQNKGNIFKAFKTDKEFDHFSKQTQNSNQFNIVKGNLNKLRLRPQIQNEHCESSREAMDVVDSATVVGQMFRASQDNINGISLTLESAATFASIDAITSGAGEKKAGTMEYTSDVALQAEYIKTGVVEAVRSVFTDDVGVTQDGSFACKMPMDTLADEWRVSLISTDLTGVTFSIKFAQTRAFAQAKMYFFIGDGTNTKSFPLSIATINVWQTFTITEISMVVESTDDTANAPNMAAITKMGFRVDDRDLNEFGYADSITYQEEPGSIDIELWNMGASLPASNGSVDYTTKTQYTELGDRGIGDGVVSSIRLRLIGGKRNYHIDELIAGVALEIPSNTILTIGNYYALVLKYVDTNVTVYGANTTFSIDYYTNGYAWKAEVADNLIDIIVGAAGAGAYSDLEFQIFSTQDIYIVNSSLFSDVAPGNDANASVFIEDQNMKVTDIIASSQKGGLGRITVAFDTMLRPIFMKKGGKIETYYNDDPTDSVSVILFTMDYLFIPPTIYG